MGDGDVIPVEVIDLENDHFYKTLIRCRGSSTRDPISVEQYAENRQLQREITASSLQMEGIIDLSEEDELVEIRPTRSFRRRPFTGVTIIEAGESSNSSASTFICEICVEPKSQSESFHIKGCSHSYCSECMIKYVASKIQENITSIGCPEMNCEGVLEPELCRSILPSEVFDRWGNALCESVILGYQRFYCPYKDCSALLVDDSGEVVKESECPYCRRMFCAQCKVSWHSGIVCEEFQKLNEDERGKEDMMLLKLAKKKKWQRCPKCRFYVEKSEGCLYMKCRCGNAFCYSCGGPMNSNHYCAKCKR